MKTLEEVMDHLTPEEEIQFEDWIFENSNSITTIKHFYHIKGKGYKTKEELYAVFKSEKEDKLKE